MEFQKIDQKIEIYMKKYMGNQVCNIVHKNSTKKNKCITKFSKKINLGEKSVAASWEKISLVPRSKKPNL